MKYASLDIETTGIDKQNCQVIQIGVVIDDLMTPVHELPRFEAFINHDVLKFEPFALNLHLKTGLLSRYLEDKNKESFNAVALNLRLFFAKHYPLATPKDKYYLAGKNLASFDVPFLRAGNDEMMNTLLNQCGHRVIDPATYFTDFINDKAPASLDDCKKRAGIGGGVVAHD